MSTSQTLFKWRFAGWLMAARLVCWLGHILVALWVIRELLWLRVVIKLYFECLFMMIHCVSKETLKVNAMCFILFYFTCLTQNLGKY